ncbi:MAG: T9SS type A sorting domain-containing protein, partial [Candidatus Latescibacteria bacterium]|nr:T9SS type A sorting domain-containing protein [Candidatus Latescibacterota bacterium]
SWSPDGRKIAFAVSYPWILNNGVRNGDKYAIYTVDFEPGNFEKLTAVNEKPLAGFAITGNYPNPFNPATTISFTLPEAGKATLTVYDITGRKVREIVNGQLAGGMHTVVWNGCDTFGRSVSSGVYFSRLTMNGITTANRMLLAK